MVPVPTTVRDEPGDEGFAATFAALPDATDLEPWLAWCRRVEGPVLYVGPGAGRLAVPLWHAGVRLVAVDRHPGMVRRLRARVPEMEVVEAALETADLVGRRFELVIGPSSILSADELLEAAARRTRRWVGMELMNPHWLASASRESVRVDWMTEELAQIEVTYPNGDVQEATPALCWPERVEDRLARVGLELEWMGTRPGLELDDSPTYFVLSARSPRKDR
jgi:hypothetical protein